MSDNIHDLSSLIEHPRRNLGNRYRAQANRFVKLAKKDPERSLANYDWAEQNARQAILHDFTDEENWRCLAQIKHLLGDGEGLEQTLRDLFTVLGRNPEHIDQLIGIDHLEFGLELLDAVFKRDPLDSKRWWKIVDGDSLDENLREFSSRCKKLDFRDQRANIIFARRIQILRENGRVEQFVDLSKYLLAHRPQNHELWMDLGRLHETRKEMGDAWLCYDQVQTLRPRSSARDLFLERMHSRMDDGNELPWSGIPTVEDRTSFLQQMEKLASSVSIEEETHTIELEDEVTEDRDLSKLKAMMENGNFQEAFFYARRLVAQGESWAEEWMNKAKDSL